MASVILPKRTGLFRYSSWDAVPVLFAFVHLAYLVSMYLAFTRLRLPLPAKIPLMAAMGIVYSFSISWNINGISHNFIHNRFFNSRFLNRITSIVISVDCFFSQVIYDYIHRRHHMGNADKPDDQTGRTIDPLSIYQHGHDGHAEKVWKYMFTSFFREEPMVAYREIKRQNPREAQWGLFEMGLTGALMIGSTGGSCAISCPAGISATAAPTSTATTSTSAAIPMSPWPGA